MKHHRRMALWLLLVLATTPWLAACAAAVRQPAGVPATDARQVMEEMVIPASDALFNFSLEPPATEEGWSALRSSTVTLVESGRLLMTDSRRSDPAWNGLSQEMVDAALAALSAVEARNEEAILDAGDGLLDACIGCHARYLE